MDCLKPATDQQLIIELQSGNKDSFTEIYNRYWAEMYWHAFRMIKDEDNAKDIVQDVFSNLWLKASSINKDSKLSGLLYIAIRNRIFNLIAKNKIRSDYLKSLSSFIDNSPSIELLMDEKEIFRALEEAINTLPAKMRLIFELSRKENLSHKEIAELLNISEQTVKKQVHNALKILRPKLSALGFGIILLSMMR